MSDRKRRAVVIVIISAMVVPMLLSFLAIFLGK